jgi:hypothetical protein
MTREEAIRRLRYIRMDYLGYPPFLEPIDMAIEALSADAEWIPVSDRLPNEDECGWYLVTVKGHELFVDVAPFNYELWEGLDSHQKVIAWKPLPKPYREESEVEE